MTAKKYIGQGRNVLLSTLCVLLAFCSPAQGRYHRHRSKAFVPSDFGMVANNPFEGLDWLADQYTRLRTVAEDNPGITSPDYSIQELKAGYAISLDIPGVQKSDIFIQITGGELLTIKAKRLRRPHSPAAPQPEAPKEEPDSGIRGSPEGVTFYERQFQLGRDVDMQNVQASYENGELILRLPKKAEALPTTIPIHSDGKQADEWWTDLETPAQEAGPAKSQEATHNTHVSIA